MRTRENFMKIKKEAICNFNEYSFNFIAKIRRESEKQAGIAKKEEKNKIRFKKNCNAKKSLEKKDHQYRPWSRLEEEFDEIQMH